MQCSQIRILCDLKYLNRSLIIDLSNQEKFSIMQEKFSFFLFVFIHSIKSNYITENIVDIYSNENLFEVH